MKRSDMIVAEAITRIVAEKAEVLQSRSQVRYRGKATLPFKKFI